MRKDCASDCVQALLEHGQCAEVLRSLWREDGFGGGNGMSIYIKGMGVPKACLGCVFYRKDDPVYDYCCISSAVPDWMGIPQGCPIIPVPDHGRLIDVDAMEKIMSDTVQGDIRGYPYSDTLWETAFRCQRSFCARTVPGTPRSDFCPRQSHAPCVCSYRPSSASISAGMIVG